MRNFTKPTGNGGHRLHLTRQHLLLGLKFCILDKLHVTEIKQKVKINTKPVPFDIGLAIIV